jgi:integrase
MNARICDAAKVPRVCPHGLRGTHSTIGMPSGLAVQAVAEALGHEDSRTTLRHYIAGGAAEAAQAQRALKLIAGGKR